ncbi:PQQ-binding-like beta-propeller repeat protein, partial [Streptomyces sp. NRRL B-24085]
PSYDPPQPAPVPVGAPDTGPVRLAGAQVPIGPGPRVADARAAAVKAPPPEAGLVASWSRPRPGVNGTDAAVGPAVPAPPPAPPETAAGWRPWRFRMSNDVWGTPAVAGDLVYVTSFEVHALDVGTGRR